MRSFLCEAGTRDEPLRTSGKLLYMRKKKLSHLQTSFFQAPAGCSFGIGDRRILVYYVCSGKRSVACDYFIFRRGAPFKILSCDVTPTGILHENPVSLSTNFLYTAYSVSKFFHNNEVKIVVFIGLFMLESFSFIFNFKS